MWRVLGYTCGIRSGSKAWGPVAVRLLPLLPIPGFRPGASSNEETGIQGGHARGWVRVSPIQRGEELSGRVAQVKLGRSEGPEDRCWSLLFLGPPETDGVAPLPWHVDHTEQEGTILLACLSGRNQDSAVCYGPPSVATLIQAF